MSDRIFGIFGLLFAGLVVWVVGRAGYGLTFAGAALLLVLALLFVSRAAQADIARLKARMGWRMPWFTLTDGFDADFGVDEWHGTNVFYRDDSRVFRTYFLNNRGDEQMGNTWNYLDITPLGRQESWEDSPEGYPQTPAYNWWNWHDSYVAGAQPDRKWVEVSDAGGAAMRKQHVGTKP